MQNKYMIIIINIVYNNNNNSISHYYFVFRFMIITINVRIMTMLAVVCARVVQCDASAGGLGTARSNTTQS